MAVSQRLVRLRAEIVTELAIARNYLLTMSDCVRELKEENNRLVGGTPIGSRMNQDLGFAASHLRRAAACFSEASRMAQNLRVCIEVTDPSQNEERGAAW